MFHVEHFYWAQIAFEIVRANVPNPKRWAGKLKDFLIKFKKNEPVKPLTEAEKKTRLQQSKANWFGFLGIKPKKD